MDLTIDKYLLSMVSHPGRESYQPRSRRANLRPVLERRAMSEPQHSIRSAKAKALAQALARRIGMPMNRLVEEALERFDGALRAGAHAHPIDALWDRWPRVGAA